LLHHRRGHPNAQRCGSAGGGRSVGLPEQARERAGLRLRGPKLRADLAQGLVVLLLRRAPAHRDEDPERNVTGDHARAQAPLLTGSVAAPAASLDGGVSR